MPERKPFPRCCAEVESHGGVWWEETGSIPGYETPDRTPGWTMISNVAIQMRTFWKANIKFCPYCGTKLPETPPA